MKATFNIIGLAFRDYSHEWRMSGCFILGLAAVLAPMMILFGLKFGIITSMVQELVENPKNREIRPTGSGHYDPEWFQKMRERKDVAFVIPRTRTLAASIDLKSETAPNIVSTELLPTGRDDPLLKQVKDPPKGLDQVVLSEAAARKLNVTAGASIEGSLTRQYHNTHERVQFKLKVVDVANSPAFSQPGVFADLGLVVAAENFRDGHAVPALGWTGDPSMETGRAFPSYRLYARSIHDVAGLSAYLNQAGHQIKTNTAEIETIQSMDRNLSIIYWIIALAGMIGFSLSLGASLWANVDRKRRDLSVLRLVGFRTRGIILFPVSQSLLTGFLGWLSAVLVYLIVEKTINQMLAARLEEGQTICYLLPEHFALALALTLVSAMLAALLGGYRAARIEPSEGLREI
jgi:putative ABC transport system permease protein